MLLTLNECDKIDIVKTCKIVYECLILEHHTIQQCMLMCSGIPQRTNGQNAEARARKGITDRWLEVLRLC